MAQVSGDGGDESPAAEMPEPAIRRSTFTPATPDAYQQFVTAPSSFTSGPIDAPPPNPSTLVTPPPGSVLPRPPQRKSLGDDEIVSTLTDPELRTGGTLEAIERLQEQLRYREQDAREFRSWESSMRAIGTPEALETVEEVRTTFTEAIQVIPPFTGTVPAAPAGQPVDDTPPPAPRESPRTEAGDVMVPDDVPSVQRALTPEATALLPTIPEERTGRPFRLFWLWFAANSSVLGIVLGAILLSLGMSLRQAIVATLAGAAASFLPIGLATLAGKWNGQPTMVASRASFGVVGNVVPGILAVVTRLLWAAVLLWFLASATAELLIAAGASGGLSVLQLTIAAGGVGFLIALTVAFFGFRLLATVQAVLSVVAGVAIIAVVAVTWSRVDLPTALTVADGPWALVLTGAIVVFSFIGLAWASGAGDVARYQRATGAGAGSMLTASFGSALPAFLLISYGAVLAASDQALAFSFIVDPVGALATIVPPWFLVPLIGAVGAGLLSGVTLSVYSGGFALAAVAPRLRREFAVLLTGVAVGATSILLVGLTADFSVAFRDLATTLAVPTAAWLGIFAADIMIRNRRYDSRSLVQRGGVYPEVNWVNLGMFLAATAIGYGLTTASVAWLSWQGYLLGVLGIPSGSDLARADVGVVAALVVALLSPLVFGVRAVRRQEGVDSGRGTTPAGSVETSAR